MNMMVGSHDFRGVRKMNMMVFLNKMTILVNQKKVVWEFFPIILLDKAMCITFSKN